MSARRSDVILVCTTLAVVILSLHATLFQQSGALRFNPGSQQGGTVFNSTKVNQTPPTPPYEYITSVPCPQVSATPSSKIMAATGSVETQASPAQVEWCIKVSGLIGYLHVDAYPPPTDIDLTNIILDPRSGRWWFKLLPAPNGPDIYSFGGRWVNITGRLVTGPRCRKPVPEIDACIEVLTIQAVPEPGATSTNATVTPPISTRMSTLTPRSCIKTGCSSEICSDQEQPSP